MLETALFFVNNALLLLFGICASAAFSGIRLHWRNIPSLFGIFVFCGIIQLVCYLTLSEDAVRKLYPLITHLPCVLFLCLFYRKSVVTALASVFSAYLCCQFTKWFAILANALSGSLYVEYLVRILCLLAEGAACLLLLAPYLSRIFNKDHRSVCIFGLLPTVYYIFDYITVVYTSFLQDNNQIAVEFLPFFFCIAFLMFCVVYYKEYEQKVDAERKESIIRIAVEQQAKEIEAVRQNEHALRLLRHDMRHFLNSLALLIKNAEQDKALEMVAAYTSDIDALQVNRFCGCETVNYVLSEFASKCARKKIEFIYDIGLDSLETDETLFCSILHNSLENAFNAQLLLPEGRRSVRLLLKTVDSKLLMAVKNPVDTVPLFSDGLPVSNQPGHGYGTQSIRYTTERLGGSCQFFVKDGLFVVRVIL